MSIFAFYLKELSVCKIKIKYIPSIIVSQFYIIILKILFYSKGQEEKC